MSSAKFQRNRRLLTAADFAPVFQQSIRSSDRYFTVLGRCNSLPDSRLGMAVSRKTDKRSVVRNRIRRIARETFRTSDLECGDFVVLSRPAAGSATRADLHASLNAHWYRMQKKFARTKNEPVTPAQVDSDNG